MPEMIADDVDEEKIKAGTVEAKLKNELQKSEDVVSSLSEEFEEISKQLKEALDVNTETLSSLTKCEDALGEEVKVRIKLEEKEGVLTSDLKAMTAKVQELEAMVGILDT